MYKRTILIVDDQPINRRILGQLLEDEYEIAYAEDGKQAIDFMKTHLEQLSAVLLDIVMPVMDGYQVLQIMRDDPELSKIPVIVSSQKDGDSDEVKALTLGAQDFIAKPYKVNIIRHRLENTIRFRETAAMVNKTERDETTGLYNKQFFVQRTENLLKENPGELYDIICIGVERFKLINDTYGIAGGDQVLRYLGNLLLDLCMDTKVCGRFDADNFYGILPHHEKYTNEMFEPWLEKVKKCPIDMEIKLNTGIYEIHDNTISIQVMCDRAQLAAEKNRGKYDEHFYLYDESIREQLLEEQFIVSNMHAGIEQNQFQVYYQPKYDLNSELVAGAEALVRWIHPEKGFMSPGEFIPLFEKNGFITQLDQFVWERACQDIRSWINQGFSPVAVSVNVSRADIYNPKLVEILLGLVTKYEIPIRYLHLEITESAYTENPSQIIEVVSRLRDLGFSIEMDDFGSGYSSLNMLADMPVDVLKLDIGFIQSETKNASGKGILSFVISLAKWLNLAVVAEGVETKDQVAVLRSMDCNYVQGYYYAKPMKEEDFHKLISENKTTEMVCTSQTMEDYSQTNQEEQTKDSKDEQSNESRIMMIVDDIDINRSVLASAFKDKFAIKQCENGQVAWDYLQENASKVTIIMLDLLMPVMDGFQLLEKIRSTKEMENIPVIITSQGDAEKEQRALRMRADDFISKPYNAEIIGHRVANVVARYELHKLKEQESHEMSEKGLTSEELVNQMLVRLRRHFDMVRLVDPRKTQVILNKEGKCQTHSCYSVWEKKSRCKNCISIRAYENRTRLNKIECSADGRFFVIAEYVPYGESGAVIEMVTKLEDETETK